VSSRVLRLDGECNSGGLVEVIASPQSVEELETEISPECFLDHLAVALTGSGRAHLHSPQDVFIDCQGRTRL
jgi:hypothetical protein